MQWVIAGEEWERYQNPLLHYCSAHLSTYQMEGKWRGWNREEIGSENVIG